MSRNKKDKIVLFDAPEAAKEKTKTIWVSRTGRLFLDERSARFDGCTHRKCEKCGAVCEKSWLICKECRSKVDRECFLRLPEVEWDGKTPLCIFRSDTYFFDDGELEDYCEEHECMPQDLELVLCEPVYLRKLSDEYFLSDLGNEDVELPKDVQQLVAKFNQELEKLNSPIVWEASNKRVAIT